MNYFWDMLQTNNCLLKTAGYCGRIDLNHVYYGYQLLFFIRICKLLKKCILQMNGRFCWLNKWMNKRENWWCDQNNIKQSLQSIGILMYKHHTNQLPSNYSTYFTKHTQTHNYSTRNTQDYTMNKTKKAFSDRATRNCGTVLFCF